MDDRIGSAPSRSQAFCATSPDDRNRRNKRSALFPGAGRSLAAGGPASMLVSYIIVGIIVFNTMLALGEMAAFMPIAGSFCTFAGRFVDDAFGFALTWNYWFNDAVSMAHSSMSKRLFWSICDSSTSVEREVGRDHTITI